MTILWIVINLGVATYPRVTVLSQAITKLNDISNRHVSSEGPSIIHSGIWAGLIFCRPYIGNHSCWRLTDTIAIPCTEVHIWQFSSYPSAPPFFLPPLLWRFEVWVVGICCRWPIHGWTLGVIYSQHFEPLWVSALTTEHKNNPFWKKVMAA